MYHVLATGAVSLLLYFFTLILNKTGFIPTDIHRKIWNFILVFTFVLTATAGLFIALQISYKWEIPNIKTILRWHVESGIGFAFAGIFHFLRHFRYYLTGNPYPSRSRSVLSDVAGSFVNATENLFLIGFISTAAQIILMREILNIAGGFEFAAGAFLGAWLLASAAGSVSERFASEVSVLKINLLFLSGFVITVLLLILFNILLLAPGESPSFLETVLFSIIVLLPFCFVSGYSFTKLLRLNDIRNKTIAGRSFSIETAGGITSGLIISVLVSGILNNYSLLLTLLILYSGYIIIRFLVFSTLGRVIIFALLPVLIAALIIFNVDVYFRGLLMRGTGVTSTKDTPYGNITTGIYGGEESIFYNQRLIRWNEDDAEQEENIHYALLQHPHPVSVLLISGDISASSEQLEKYNVKKIVYVERDPELVKRFVKTVPEVVVVEKDDAFRYVKNTVERFDVIIIQLPPPSTLVLNRFYTASFFSDLKSILYDGGIIQFSPGVSENYINKESVVYYSSLFNTVGAVFRHVLPVKGQRLYFLASDAPLSSSFCVMAEEKNIVNTYVNSFYLSDDLTEKKTQEILSLMERSVRINTGNRPSAVFYYQGLTLSKFPGERLPLFLLVAIILGLPLLSLRKDSIPMYTSAAALASFEIIILITLQSTIGAMYQLTGLVIACIMAGLATGSGIRARSALWNSVHVSFAGMFLFYFMTGLLINGIYNEDNKGILLIIMLISGFVPAFFTGSLFRILTLKYDSSLIYTADLAGSSMGFLAITIFIFPVLGIQNTIFVLSGLIFTGFLFGTVSSK